MNDALLEAIDRATVWMDLDGVEGVADGMEEGRPCIVVACSRPVHELADQIPSTFRGFPVRLEPWGSISAQGPE